MDNDNSEDRLDNCPQDEAKIPSKYSLKSTRFCIALLMMFGFFARTAMRVNMSMAIVCMVNTTYSDSSLSITELKHYQNVTDMSSESKCHKLTLEEAVESGYNGDLPWDQKKIALLFSAAFYGMLSTVWVSINKHNKK